MATQQSLDFETGRKRIRTVFMKDKIKMIIWLSKNASNLNGKPLSTIRKTMTAEFGNIPQYTALLTMLRECGIEPELLKGPKRKKTKTKTTCSRGDEQVTKRELLQQSYKIGKSGMAVVDALSTCIGFLVVYGELSLQAGRVIQDELAEAYLAYGKLRRAPKDVEPKSPALLTALKGLRDESQLETEN